MNLIVCPSCEGKGASLPNYYDCPTCMGSGWFDAEGYPTDLYGAWFQARTGAGQSTSDEEFQKYYNELLAHVKG